MDVRVVLVAVRNPLNIGAAARAMSNFGFSCLRLVNPYDVAFREAKSAVGAGAVLASAKQFGTLAEAVEDCRLVVGTTSASHRELKHPIRRLEDGARLIRKHAGPVALLFGSEKFGLSNEDLSHCHWLMHIPTSGEQGSMNLGQAVAVCLYELTRDVREARREPKAVHPAGAGDLERITELLLEVLETSGYINPKTAASTGLKVRRMIRRLSLSAADVEVWQGMLRQVLWKLREKV